ncbi:IQ calmodulin-binding motif domain protein [Botrytis cinerea]
MKMTPPLVAASYPDCDEPLDKNTSRRSLGSVRENVPTANVNANVNARGGNYKPYEEVNGINGINGNTTHEKCDSKIKFEDTTNSEFTFPSRSATTTTTTSPANRTPTTTNPNHNRSNSRLPHSRSNSQHSHHQSRVSVSSKASSKSHQEYINSLVMPPPEVIQEINHVQEEKEKEAIARRLSGDPNLSEDERRKAAELIQRNYRGHRERRILEGKRLDVGTRWVEAVKEARYRNLTTPRARDGGENEGGRRSSDVEGEPPIDTEGIGSSVATSQNRTSHARENWKKIGMIARRAGGDEESDEESDGDSGDLNEEERAARRKRRMEEKAARQKAAKIMDLQYFLEMVDLKHRYGSNLRTYHGEWKKANTNENFFYWLDYGEGRFIDCQGCPRERLDREQVRYLSKEERLDYLVKIDGDGRLRWAKNGERIDTTTEWRDSMKGIVRNDDDTPVFTPLRGEADNEGESDSESSSDESPLHHHSHTHIHTQPQTQEQRLEAQQEESRASKYASPEYDNAQGMKKVSHMSASTIFNKLLRGSVKKNTWIFVADTSFRLYVGIKQSGAFQHSSFLHGSRISAAGLIKIKDGRLTKLSPLSGHYRPPVSNFRAFVKNLKGEGCDMGRVSISRSYAVLVGLEAYVKTRKRAKKVVGKVVRRRDKMLDKEEVRRREEDAIDKSESAEKERRFLEEEERRKREERRFLDRVVGGRLRGLSLGSRDGGNAASSAEMTTQRTHTRNASTGGTGHNISPAVDKGKGKETEREKEAEINVPGQGPENAIPPQGIREE